MNKIVVFASVLLGVAGNLAAQDKPTNPLTIGGYAEVYYLHDFNNPLNNSRPGFVYSHNRNNEVSVNLAFIKAAYGTEKVRANFALAAGSYMNANYAAEPGVLKNIYEANAGLKLSKHHNMWVEVGIFSSHLGFESAVGKDNWTLTRSLFADNSPYYETGAKISYTSRSGRWFISGLLLNGWQRIQRVEGNTTPAFGHQIVYRPSDKLTLNSSSFVGSDKADSVRQMRYFHNLYAIYQISSKFGITAGFDMGMEQEEKASDNYNVWYTPIVLVKYVPTDRISLTARGEYYRDEHAVLISAGDTASGFDTVGYSLNADYTILDNVVWRMEFRNLQAKEATFVDRLGNLQTSSPTIATAIAVSF